MNNTFSLVRSKLKINLSTSLINTGVEISLQNESPMLLLYFSTMVSLFFSFLIFLGEKIRKNLLLKYIKRLKYLHEVISESIGFRFFSTSLLFVYDASLEDEVNDHPSLSDESYETIKLIDFAHCHYDKDSKEGDSNLLAGIENLIDCLTYILENPEIELFSGC